MKRNTYISAMSVSVLLAVCQQAQISVAEAAQTASPAAAVTNAVTNAVAGATAANGEIIIDNGGSGFKSTGSWTAADGNNDYKDGTLWAPSTSGTETANTATWTPTIKTAGKYDVFEWHGEDPGSDHAKNEAFTVKSTEGTKTIPVDLRSNAGKWNLLGTFTFAAGEAGNVSATSANADGNVLADAVKFVPHH